jgi:RNA polymerase sigma-70 factor (ECF subfamily)
LTYETEPTGNQVEINDLSEILNRAMGKLSARQKEVSDLAFLKGMSQREIADKRQISLGTVKTRLKLGRRKLRNFLLPMQNKICSKFGCLAERAAQSSED